MSNRIVELEKISENRKKHEKELSRTKAMYEGLFEFAPDAIVIMNREGRIVQVNKQAERLFGFTCQEFIQMDHDLLVPERYTSKHIVDSAGYMSDPHIRHMGTGLELYGRKKDGSEFPVDIALGPLQMEDGMVVLAVVRDFTERQRMDEELERHRKHLEEIVKERTAELEMKSIALQELNAALKVILKQREDDKKVIEETIVMNVKNLVLPCVEQMKKGRLDSAQRAYLEALETHLNGITTPLLQNMGQFNLTPKEIKVAVLVRHGKSTKQIAEILGIAGGSVDVHRRNIRKKLGLTNKKANLLSRLEILDK